jgi:hypothetical protein
MIAAVLFASAAMVHQPLNQLSQDYELVPSGDAALANNPELALLRVAPGGLRSLMINYFWMRSQTLHREGRHFDALQLSELICTLQPRFPGVWQFQAWQLAWNISATAHTPQERWHWVRAGVELLRDQGIAMNPNSLLLYKQLSWTFSSKMGDDTDDMHWYYKRKWAQDFQILLGAPPQGTTQETLDAFKPIAEALIDKNPYRTRDGETPIQDDRRRLLIDSDPEIEVLASDLRGVGVKIDESLLKAYNYCTLRDTVDVTRYEAVADRDNRLRRTANAIKDSAEKARALDELDRRAQWAKVINNPDHSKALDKTLAFVRAQILWNVHKMDPKYMYDMMKLKRLGPIDWRTVWSHGLYWSMYGTEHCKDIPRQHIDALNTDRTLLTCLKTLTWQGKMQYIAAPSNLAGDEYVPSIEFRSDWRFIEPTHQEYIRLGKERSKYKNEDFSDNPLDQGHINFLGNAIGALYIRGQRDKAQELFDWVLKYYKKNEDKVWGAADLDKFVIASLSEHDNIIPRVAIAQITASLQMAMIWLSQGDNDNFAQNINYARRLHAEYHKGATQKTQRLALQPLDRSAASILIELLVYPKSLSVDLTLPQRSVLYTSMEQKWPRPVAIAYDLIRRPLQRQCQLEELDFNKLFPPPRGLQAARQERAQQTRQRQQ